MAGDKPTDSHGEREHRRELHEGILNSHEERIRKLEDCMYGNDGILERMARVETVVGIMKKAILGDETEKGLVSRVASVEKALSHLSKAYWALFVPMLGTFVSILFLVLRVTH